MYAKLVFLVGYKLTLNTILLFLRDREDEHDTAKLLGLGFVFLGNWAWAFGGASKAQPKKLLQRTVHAGLDFFCESLRKFKYASQIDAIGH